MFESESNEIKRRAFYEKSTTIDIRTVCLHVYIYQGIIYVYMYYTLYIYILCIPHLVHMIYIYICIIHYIYSVYYTWYILYIYNMYIYTFSEACGYYLKKSLLRCCLLFFNGLRCVHFSSRRAFKLVSYTTYHLPPSD